MLKGVCGSWTVSVCLVLTMVSNVAVGHEEHTVCGASKGMCGTGFTCVPSSNSRFTCVPSRKEKASQPPKKQSKHDDEEILKLLSGSGGDKVELKAGDNNGFVGPCVGVKPEQRPHIDQGVPSRRPDVFTKTLRPTMLKNPSGMSISQIVRVFRRARSRFAQCAHRAFIKQPKLRGKITLIVDVAKNGRPATVRLKSNTTDHAPLAQCVSRVVRRFRFPPPKNGPLEFEVPLVFKPRR